MLFSCNSRSRWLERFGIFESCHAELDDSLYGGDYVGETTSKQPVDQHYSVEIMFPALAATEPPDTK